MDSLYPWYNDISRDFMSKDYLPQPLTLHNRVLDIAHAAENRLKFSGFAAKFIKYMQAGYYSLSTPVWTNYGTDRGLPISCYGSVVTDHIYGIFDTLTEVAMMTKYGGGTSAYLGQLRPRGSTITNNGNSFGVPHFLRLYNETIGVVSQGSTRRGSFAAYLDIEHGDFDEFIKIRTDGHPLQRIFTGVNVSDAFIRKAKAGDGEARRRWRDLLRLRKANGTPYILFTDNANNNAPDVYKDKGLKINASNLCTEIMLSSSEKESFVCCLMSMNISKFEEFKSTDAVETAIYFLDTVIDEFNEKASTKPGMEKAVKFSQSQRALGLGWLGWHTYLQEHSIPFDSFGAHMKNVEVAVTIKDKANAASAHLANVFGEPELLKGYGRRNVTLTAIAPTKSSSTILGQVSEGIEPLEANYFIKNTAKGEYTMPRNPALKKILGERGLDTDEVWMDIASHSGSVQHVDYLSDHEKNVFKTFREISQISIINQAAARQKHIDQGQSLNLMLDGANAKQINQLTLHAWKQGIKSLYYHKSGNAAQKVVRTLNADQDTSKTDDASRFEECSSCSA